MIADHDLADEPVDTRPEDDTYTAWLVLRNYWDWQADTDDDEA